MGGEYDRHSFLTPEMINKLPNNLSLLDIYSSSRLIENQQLWTMYEGTSKHKSSLHTTREHT
jgi:hypothetical protein